LAWIDIRPTNTTYITIEIFQAQDGDFRFDIKANEKEVVQHVHWTEVEKSLARMLA
jgi:hypothetical protein